MNKIVYYGTGNFAATILELILESEKFQIIAVITQPDRPAGRNNKIKESPVKILAKERDIRIHQPEKLVNIDIPELSQADLAVVAEYGLIIPQRFLDIPARGTVNLHASLLPKYRGASPIQSAILAGETETGVTFMRVDEKMDHGPIISMIVAPIGRDELFESLYKRLAHLAGELFIRDAEKFISLKIQPAEQSESTATYCKILGRDDGKIDFQKNAVEIYNRFRAFSHWPGVWAVHGGKRIKFGLIAVSDEKELPPGQILIRNNEIFIGCGGNSSIEVNEIQLEGKKMLSTAEFLRGGRNFASARFN